MANDIASECRQAAEAAFPAAKVDLVRIRAYLKALAAELTTASFTMPQFERYFGIDYSGAETATSSLKGKLPS